jgi:Ca-activated chloride channel homolog
MNLADFHFIRPYWLVALLPFCGALVFLIRRKLSQGNWTAVCDSELLPYLLQDTTVKQSRLPLIGGSLAGLLAIIAMAGPTLERLPTPVFRNDSALVIALDLSRSMDAGDIKPSRLTMARYKIADILKQRKDGQTALLVFADDAFTVTPLTNDTQTIDSQLSALTTAIMPGNGNNLGRAFEKSLQLLKQAGLQKGQILLLTDGGNIDQGLDQAKTLDGYQLLVLGVGTADGAPIALENGGFLKDAQGGIIVDKVDVSGLEKLAQAGNGAYQPITPDDSDINNLLATVAAKLQEQDKKNENLLLEQWRDLGPWLLLMVLPLAALSFRKGLLAVALLVFLPFPKTSYALDTGKLWQDLWQTKDQHAQHAYRQGDFGKAAELFENPDWKAVANYKAGAYDKTLESLKNQTSPNSLYNQGNAWAQSGKFQEALDAYNKALKLNPNDEDTKFNKGLVEKELEKQKQQQQQNQNNQDDKNQDKQQDSKDNKSQDPNKDGKKSDQSEQENKDQQDKADQKPEQKPEQSKESTEQQPDKKDAEEQTQDQAKSKQAEQQKDAQKDPKKPENAQQAQETELSKEEQQAAEQWLKRIPDDPAGLLRRKFKYQYDQRGQQ